MSVISGYTISEKIAESGKSIVYRGMRDADDTPVVLKIFRQSFPSPADIARFKKEYELIRTIDIDGVVKTYGLVEDKDRLALVLEDFNGLSLKEVLKKKKFSIEEFLDLAITIADTLGYIHTRSIIHKDIKPNNILYNERTGAVKITDFGISSLLTRENENIFDPLIITGTLPYMSPEQTGRINRSIDYRTDLYSLGIMFYEILTGSLPFKSRDPLEIIYCHIAREPAYPADINKDIPEPLGDIIMKLLSKNAENRYQNSYGLKNDLAECALQVRRDGKMSRFELGTRDVSNRFSIPQAFIGREREKEALREAFTRVSQGGGEMIIVTGPPGIGKTSLVHEIEKSITEHRGYFIYSKYDMIKQNVPYSAIIHAFQKLMLRILSEGPDRIALWKERILTGLGNNCQVIIDVIPELELIVEGQPGPPAIESEKAQYRFKKVFDEFIRIFTTRDHPITLFLDDLQWVDNASLQLLTRLLSDIDMKYLLIVGAYRDAELDPSHPVVRMLSSVRDRVSYVALDPLSTEHIGEYIFYLINSRKNDVLRLAGVLFRKTNGNPFFLINFLRALHDNQLLYFAAPGGWTWDLDGIEGMQVSDNVIDLMFKRISGLGPGTQNILKLASCMGNRFDLEDISALLGKDIETTLVDIQQALDEGLFYYSSQLYYFPHDRIQEVVYSLIPDNEKKEIHYRIGRLLMEKTPDTDLFDKIFYIVHQLNEGASLIRERGERIDLARLNLIAGRKAKSSTAYSVAVDYFGAGIGYLDGSSWQGEYQLAYDLHFEKAESEYLNGNFEQAFAVFDFVIEHASGKVDRAKVYDRKIIIYTNMGNHKTGMELGLKALKMFGVNIPPNPGQMSITGEVIKAAILQGRRSIRGLLDSPEITDPEKIMILTLCMDTGTAAYFVNNNVVALLAMKMVNLSLRYGNTKVSAFAYLSYGLILGYGMGRYGLAYRFGELAIELNEKFNDVDLKPRILFIFGFLISHWKKHYNRTIELLRRSYKIGVETGDINYAVFSAINLTQYRIRLGENLDRVYQDLADYQDFLFRTRNEEFILEFVMNQRFILCHKGRTRSLSDFSDDEFSEKDFVEKISKYRVTTHSYYLYKMMSLYLAKEFEAALEFAVKAKDSIREVLFAQSNVALFYYYYSLILAALYPVAAVRDRRKYRAHVRKNQKLLRKWAAHSPENYGHKYLLVEAELAAILGDTPRAAALFGDVIREAVEHGFLLDEALGNELAGKFYLFQGSEFIARAYLLEARYCYGRYGSTAMTDLIGQYYPRELNGDARPGLPGEAGESTTGSSGANALDFTTLLKTSQILSGEIVLEKLLKKLVIVIGECAAATRGALILEKDGRLIIEASGDINLRKVNVLQGTPIESSNEVPAAVIHYVARTKENLVLNDAANSGLFVNDPYIRKNMCKSVLCLPIMYQAKLSALFYAENNLTTGAFTEDRIELLKTLASYVAISVDNASLYANLEEKVQERTKALEYAYGQVTEAYRIIQEDISLARRIQENILSRHMDYGSRFNIDVHFYPMSQVGGDIYDIVEIKPGILRVFLADATGHGIQAALVTMLIKSEYEKIKNVHISPPELMNILNNEFIYRYTNLVVLFSCVIIDIDINGNQARYASAGHPDQYIIHNNEISVLSRTGKIVGFVKDQEYKVGELPFTPGDKVILFSDGIYEEFDMELKEYGEKRLMAVIQDNSRQPVQAITKCIIQDVRNFIGKEKINSSDDVTIIAVEVQ